MKKILLLTTFAALILTGCSEADDYPVISTVAIYSDGETVTMVANLSDDGGGKTTAGVCWDLETYPTVSDEYSGKQRKEGEYSVIVSNLEAGQEYYFRAYAKNSEATIYGTQYSIVIGEPIMIIGSAGKLETMAGRFGIADEDKLTMKGYINKLDFDFMRDGMPNLADIDISAVSISTYTDESTLIKYVANNIPTWAFASDTGNNVPGTNNTLVSIALPETLWYIDDYAFANCKSLTGGITLPEAVQIIGANAYYGCTGLNGTLELYGKEDDSASPDLRHIEEGAFNGCSGLTGTLDIPSSVTFIGANAFADCNGFTSITVSWTTPLAYTENMLPMKDVYVPAGSEEAYRSAAGWGSHNIFTNQE